MSRDSIVSKKRAFFLSVLPLLWLVSCGTIMLPPLEVASCKVAEGKIVVQFTAPPSPQSLDAGLTVTEDGEKMEGQLRIHGDSAEFIPRYGLKAHHDYMVRVEAGTEDVNGHSLMEPFVYEYSTRSHRMEFSVELVAPVEADHRLVEGELHVLEGLSQIQLEFSSPVDRKSLEEGLSLSPRFDYVLLYANQDCQVTIQPLEQLEVNNRYLVSLSSSVTDRYRNPLPKELGWSFYYGLDVEPPELAFFLLPQDQEERSFWPETAGLAQVAVSSSTLRDGQGDVEGASPLELAANDWILVEFSEAVDLDVAASALRMEPVSLSQCAVAPPLEIKLNHEHGRQLKVRPLWTGDMESQCWGSIWRLVVDSRLKDRAGNEMEEPRSIILSYTKESQRPPQFLGALMVDGAGKLAVLFSPQLPLGEMALDVDAFPTTTEVLPQTVTLHLFFGISAEAKEIARTSLMEHASIQAANDCCEVTLKRLVSTAFSQEIYENYLQLLTDHGGQEDTVEGTMAMASFQVELLNRDQAGLVTLELSGALKDNLGNAMGTAAVCRVNKL